jgi:hypothetical protein
MGPAGESMREKREKPIEKLNLPRKREKSG